MNFPLVSFIIPTFNRLNYLKLAINSIRSQTNDDYEIIVTENNCTDGTKEWLKKQDDINSLYNNKETTKAIENWNKGIKQAKGKYIIILSDDDIVSNNMVTVIKDISSKYNDLGMIIFNHKCINENNEIINKYIMKQTGFYKRGEAFKFFANGINNRVCAIAFSGQYMKKCNYFDERFEYVSDSMLIQKMSIIANVFFVDEKNNIPSYRIWSNSCTKKTILKNRWHREIIIWCNEMMEFTKENMGYNFSNNKSIIIRNNYLFAIKSNFNKNDRDELLKLINNSSYINKNLKIKIYEFIIKQKFLFNCFIKFKSIRDKFNK